MKKLLGGLILLQLCASANTISFTGNLRTDATVVDCGSGCTLGAGDSDADFAQWAAVVDLVHVGTTSTLQAITFSYGGGVNGAGTNIAEGGFAPYLSLFDSSGNFLASTYFGTVCPTGAKTNTLSGQCYDERLDAGILSPGDYRIAITAFENLSLAENYGSGALADGFTGLGNLFDGEDLHYAFDVTLTDASPVPEPSTSILIPAAVLIGFLFQKRKGVTQ